MIHLPDRITMAPNIKINKLLQKFLKKDIINILEELNHELPPGISKQKAIGQAVSFLKKKFQDLDTLLLFLHLKAFEKQHTERNWTMIKIKEAKNFSKPLIAEKVSKSLVKYFKAYEKSCKVYSEKKGECLLMVLFIERSPLPTCIIAHPKSSAVYFSKAPGSETLISTVLIKSFKGQEIYKQKTIKQTAYFILNDQLKEVHNEEEKRKAIYDKKIRKLSGSECVTESNERERKSSQKRKCPGKEKLKKNILNNSVDVEAESNVRKRKSSEKRKFAVREKLNKNILNNSVEVDAESNERERKSSQKRKYEMTKRNPDKEKLNKNIKSVDVEAGTIQTKRRCCQFDFNEKEKKKNFESETGNDQRERKIPQQTKCPLKKKHNKDICKCPKSKADDSETLQRIQGDKNNMESIQKATDKSCLPKSLKYSVKSSFFCKKETDEEDTSNPQHTFSVVIFEGNNVTKGLNNLLDCGIADGPLPDYLYDEPRSGKTQFTLDFS